MTAVTNGTGVKNCRKDAAARRADVADELREGALERLFAKMDSGAVELPAGRGSAARSAPREDEPQTVSPTRGVSAAG